VSFVRGVLAVAGADFLERVRRHRTLVTTGAMVMAAHFFLPPIDSRYITLQLDDFRPLYGSAYVGMLCAILCNAFLSLAGFYVAKDAVDRDRTTRVGEILASTPLTRFAYVAGKWLSNFALLTGMVMVVAIASVGIQLLRAEDTRLDLVALFAPYLFVTLPVMAVTASLAVFFEVAPGLRGGVGNVVFFFLWGLLVQIGGSFNTERPPAPGSDLVGFSLALPSFYEAQARAYPAELARRDHFSSGVNFKKDATWRPRTFEWPGLRWTLAIAWRRLLWGVAALALLGVSALIFDRFERTGDAPQRKRRRGREPMPALGEPAAIPHSATAPVHLTALSTEVRRPTLAPLVVQEFVLLLKGTTRWWWVPVLGLSIASSLSPLQVVLDWLLPFLWIWPLLHWSSLGAREQRHGTIELTMSAPRPVLRPVLASWLAGFALALGVAVVVLVRLFLAGAWPQLGGVLAGAAFIPALAIGLGTWTGSGKLFEVLYLLLWYMAVNRVPALDYFGASAGSAGAAPPWTWAALAAAMLAVGLAGRARLAKR
jgi:ABC-2 family transporter protein